MATCFDCAFYDATHDDNGVCRANPPVPVPDYGRMGCWPRVPADAWCGCHTPENTADAPPLPSIPAERTDPWTDIGYTRPATANQKED